MHSNKNSKSSPLQNLDPFADFTNSSNQDSSIKDLSQKEITKLNIERINSSKKKVGIYGSSSNDQENVLPSYDMSTNRGIIFKTPRYDTNTLEFMRNEAKYRSRNRKSRRQTQKVQIQYEPGVVNQIMTEEQFHPWSNVKPFHKGRFNKNEAKSPKNKEHQERVYDSRHSAADSYHLRKRTDEKIFDPNKKIRGVQPIELSYSDQQVIESGRESNKFNNSIHNSNKNRDSQRSNSSNASDWIYNTQGVDVVNTIPTSKGEEPSSQNKKHEVEKEEVVVEVENSFRDSFFHKAKKPSIQVCDNDEENLGNIESRLTSFRKDGLSSKEEQTDSKMMSMSEMVVQDSYTDYLLERLNNSLSDTLYCKSNMDLCKKQFLELEYSNKIRCHFNPNRSLYWVCCLYE